VRLTDLVRNCFRAKRAAPPLPGEVAPPISLTSLDGEKHTLAEALAAGPVLAAFFKVSCPICQFTFPFLERIHQAYGGGSRFTFWGISQNDAEDTREFLGRHGVKFPTLLDDVGYTASNAYGLTNVPTIFLIAPDGKIQICSVGFSKADIQKIAAEAARAIGKPAISVFAPTENVPDYKPG
jgi:peroxiredoxin